MKRKAARIVYWFEARLPRGAGFQLGFVLIALAFLTLAGGLSHRHLASGHGEPFWWAFLRLTDTGYLGEDSQRGLGLRVVSAVLSLAGNLLFCGAMVAIFTTALDRYLHQLERGRGQLIEDGHFLILGWNERIPALVEELLTASARLGLRRPSIAVLSRLDAASATAALKRHLNPAYRRKCRLLLRTGDPLEVEDLRRMDIAHARAILLVASGADRSTSDLLQAKIVLTLKTELPQPPRQHRATVVEVAASANKRLAESVGWTGCTRAVGTREIVGRLLAQAVRHPGITDVYAHLLTDTFGESIYFVAAAPYANATVRALLSRFPRAVPLGFLASDGRVVMHIDTPVPGDSRLVLLASNQEACLQVTDGDPPPCSEPSRESVRAGGRSRVLVCGWNPSGFAFLSELAAEPTDGFAVTLAASLDAEQSLALGSLNYAHFSLETVTSRLESREELSRLGPQNYDKVVLLSGEDENPSRSDAETVMRCVLLQELLAGTGIPLAVQLKDEDNRRLLGTDLDVLVTDQTVSHLLAQVAVEPDLLAVFEELFTRGGAELQFEPLRDYAAPGTDFSGCQSAALRRRRIALGWRLAPAGARAAGLYLNPARDSSVQPEAGDVLITLVPEG